MRPLKRPSVRLPDYAKMVEYVFEPRRYSTVWNDRANSIYMSLKKPIIEWIDANVRQRWRVQLRMVLDHEDHLHHATLYFGNERDASLFKMFWL